MDFQPLCRIRSYRRVISHRSTVVRPSVYGCPPNAAELHRWRQPSGASAGFAASYCRLLFAHTLRFTLAEWQVPQFDLADGVRMARLDVRSSSVSSAISPREGLIGSMGKYARTREFPCGIQNKNPSHTAEGLRSALVPTSFDSLAPRALFGQPRLSLLRRAVRPANL